MTLQAPTQLPRLDLGSPHGARRAARLQQRLVLGREEAPRPLGGHLQQRGCRQRQQPIVCPRLRAAHAHARRGPLLRRPS